MANWANPTITTQYDVFVTEAKDRDVDAATMFLNAPTNPPVGSVKMSRLGASKIKLQEWDGAVFGDVILDVPGGGTGASTAAGARSALGIGTMGTQNSNAVTITGGTAIIDGLTLKTSIAFNADGVYSLGTYANQVDKAYFRNAVVLPVGVDKYATS